MKIMHASVRMADCKTKHASATAIILFAFFFLQFLSIPVAGDSPAAYQPIDNIALDCGSSDNSTDIGGTRTWVGDINSKFFPSHQHQNDASISLRAQRQSSFYSTPTIPYMTARLSRSEFTYFFTLSPGQKFLRLYFYSAPYPNFDRSKAVFSVTTGLYTLLCDFDASLTTHASDSDTVFKEFCVYVEGNGQNLNLTLTPTPTNQNQDSNYAFVSGIEIVSMPTNLYYTPPDPNDQGNRVLKHIGQNIKFFPIENYTALEMVYRMNIGGKAISPTGDTGMFRTWSEERFLMDPDIYDARPANLSIILNYTETPQYTAPEDVYQTARTMGPNHTLNKSYNLTWKYPVDPGFYYMLRLHFCEFQSGITDVDDRVFLIYVEDMIAEQSADVFRWAGGKGIPYLRDYVVLMPSSDDKNKVNLSLKLQANPNDFLTRYTNVILNGIEIFKLNDTNGNLAGQFLQSHSKNSNSKMVVILVPVIVVAMLALACFVLFLRCRKFTNQSSSDGTSQLRSRTNKSSKTRNSKLPTELCRYFSLAQIKVATNNFDDVFIIGVGGFGNVYKGYIDNGTTQVAIKRLKPGSKQGAKEFKAEIQMLSQLRHLHLVSLIGYCNDHNEMILVYDYMSRGTLRSHLYDNMNIDKQQQLRLSWDQRLQICIGVAKGLQYLHTGANNTIIHRDVKTTNILLDHKWVAKVSDFGLSKIGPTSMSKPHVTTVVKGSFGYMDPEYCRLQKLSEKSDVYSFGVVLCEVLCARPPLIQTTDKMRILLAKWVQQCIHEKTVTQIIDPSIPNEITLDCFKKFIQITLSCIQDEGNKRPSMNDVVRGLEFASQLQHSSMSASVELCGFNEDDWLFLEGMCCNNTKATTSRNNDNSSLAYNKGTSGIVFSELKDQQGR